jgi:hypothetical protein
MIQSPVDHLLCIEIEFLDTLSLYVGVSGASEHINDAGLIHLPGDDFCGEGEGVENIAEGAGSLRATPFLFDDMSL